MGALRVGGVDPLEGGRGYREEDFSEESVLRRPFEAWM